MVVPIGTLLIDTTCLYLLAQPYSVSCVTSSGTVCGPLRLLSGAEALVSNQAHAMITKRPIGICSSFSSSESLVSPCSLLSCAGARTFEGQIWTRKQRGRVFTLASFLRSRPLGGAVSQAGAQTVRSAYRGQGIGKRLSSGLPARQLQ